MLDRFRRLIASLFGSPAAPARQQPSVRRISETWTERAALLVQVPPCTLAQYRELVRNVPRPSAQQITNFVAFVCQSHSGYKHLPLLPPGEPFCFFIDPFAGYDRVIEQGGVVTHVERTENTPRFHYTWMTSAEYRSRFGCLSYESRAGTQFLLDSPDAVREYAKLQSQLEALIQPEKQRLQRNLVAAIECTLNLTFTEDV